MDVPSMSEEKLLLSPKVPKATTAESRRAAAAAPRPGEPLDVLCMACVDDQCDFKPMYLQRRAPLPNDIVVEMKYCGICHTDCVSARGSLASLGLINYPCVPGHELSGVVIAKGSAVSSRFEIGTHVGIGCMVDSCKSCSSCRAGLEQKCASQIGTYSAKDKSGRAACYPPESKTLGGYTDIFVVQESFAVVIPPSYPLECAGPVMCAGVTLYDPLKVYGAGPGTKVCIVGLGGLGDMGVKIAKALGCHVTVVSSTAAKEAAAKSSGADDFICSKDADSMKAAAARFDLVLNTLPVEHDYTVYSRIAKSSGKHIILGLTSALAAAMVVGGMCCCGRVKGSGIGSIAATQQVVDLCAEHNIRPSK